MLERTLELALELGLLKGSVEQIVDSTPMLGAAATQDTVRLVRGGVNELLMAVAGESLRRACELESGLEFDYRVPNEKPDCDWRSRPAREAMLTRVAADAERALRAVEAVPELIEQGAVRQAHALLRGLLGLDFDVDREGVPRLHRGTRAGRILSVHDTEMRHGRKSQHQRFDGFKLHAAATNTDEPLLTAIEVTPANEQDGPQAPALVDQQPVERRPQRLLGDTAYGSGSVRAQLRRARGRAAGAGAAGAAPRGSHRQARFRDRPRRRHGHLPSRPAGADPAASAPASAGLCSRAPPAATARCVRAASVREQLTRACNSRPSRSC